MDMNNQFREFYENLCSSDIRDDSCTTDFFQSLQLPILSSVEATSLDRDLSEIEISQAITLMKSGNAPGPDSFPVEFCVQLLPVLCKVDAEALQLGSLPPTMSKAVISVLLKQGKNPTLCDSYRPVSLVCCDNQILTKVLAVHLETVLHKIIHPDQTGFIRGRQSFGNLRRLYIIYSNTGLNPEVVVSLDAHKAFDRMEFDYLFTALRQFGFSASFISWITVLYSAPQVAVCTNAPNSPCREVQGRDALYPPCYLILQLSHLQLLCRISVGVLQTSCTITGLPIFIKWNFGCHPLEMVLGLTGDVL